MTLSRIAAMVALVVCVLALVSVAVRGGDSPEYTFIFDDAGGLIEGNIVRVNGIEVGTISDIRTRRDPQTGVLKAAVTTEINELGPLRRGTEAQIRATSLGGIANKYLALQLAPNNAPNLPDGATIPITDTRGIVSQDQLVNAFDERTRRGLQEFVKGSAAAVDGRSEDLQKLLGDIPDTLSETRRFVGALSADDGDSLRELVIQFAAVDSALAERTDTIARLTRSSGQAAAALNGQGSEIAETLAAAPDLLDQASDTLEDLPSTLQEVQRLITLADRYRGGVPERLQQLASVLRPANQETLASLARSLDRPGADNDIADLLAASVEVGRQAQRARQSVPAALQQGTPLLADTRAYTPDVIAAINGLGLVSANYDAAGHYIRAAPQFNLFATQGSGNAVDLVPRSTFDNRLQGLVTLSNRCPGSAAQAPDDGSAPSTDGGRISCNPQAVPPGGGR